jgi:hypothetical protein
VRVLFTKGMIARGFFWAPRRVLGLDMPTRGARAKLRRATPATPLTHSRRTGVALQTVVSAMVRKLVMIVGSGMGLGIDDHRRLFRRGLERVASRSTAGGTS